MHSDWQKVAHLVAVTEHGGENVLQQRQDVLVGFEQTPHGLQLHHLRVRALCDWEVKEDKVTTAWGCFHPLTAQKGGWSFPLEKEGQ